MSRLLSLLLALLAMSALGAEVKLTVPTTAPKNSLVRVSAQDHQEGDSYLWDVISAEDFVDIQPYSEDSMCFTGGPGRYLVKVTALRGGKLVGGRAVVTIEDSGPGPGPGPDPPTPPGPGPDPGNLDALGKISWTNAKALTVKDTIPAVALAYRDVIKKAEALTTGYASIQEIQTQLQDARAKAQGDPASWTSWNNAIKAEWDKAWQGSAGKLTKADVLKFHKSVASGLEAAVSPSARSR